MSRYNVTVRYNQVGSGGGNFFSVDVEASSESDAKAKALHKVKHSHGSKAAGREYRVSKVIKRN